MRALHATVLAAVIGLGLTALPASPASAAPPRAQGKSIAAADRPRVLTPRLHRAVRRLPVAPERRVGYDRDRFNLWIDADQDCKDTRAEVLTQESRRRTTGDCTIETGRWYSYYDGVSWRLAGDVDIDHLVPLAEAWDSGARGWTAGTRERYANDLRDRRTLVAVTDNVNQSKGDQDFREWTPDLHVCRYLREWTAVKLRWSLTVDRREKRALVERASGCGNPRLRVVRAEIGRR